MKEILNMLSSAVQQAIDGEIPATELYVQLTELEKYTKFCKENILDAAMSEVAKYGKGEHELYGAKVSVRSTAGTWNFDNVDSWKDAKERLKSIEEIAKNSFKLKQKGFTVVDGDEIIDGATYKDGKDTIFVSLSKNSRGNE